MRSKFDVQVDTWVLETRPDQSDVSILVYTSENPKSIILRVLENKFLYK